MVVVSGTYYKLTADPKPSRTTEKATGHESRPSFCFVGFGTDRLRREEAMKTAGGENPNRYNTVLVAFRAFGTKAREYLLLNRRLDFEKKSGP
jgi:hypothetical protein